jgi:hypothetical protein
VQADQQQAQIARGIFMTTPKSSDTADIGTHHHSLSTGEKIQLWEHFVTTGGADKDRMVTIVTWLLAFSAALFGYIATEIVGSDGIRLTDPLKATTLAGLGILVSLFAVYITWAYHVHARWNWAKADEFAAEAAILQQEDGPKAREDVFWVFYALVGFSLIVHGAVLVWSVCC